MRITCFFFDLFLVFFVGVCSGYKSYVFVDAILDAVFNGCFFSDRFWLHIYIYSNHGF